jgi:hypothetical protein
VPGAPPGHQYDVLAGTRSALLLAVVAVVSSTAACQSSADPRPRDVASAFQRAVEAADGAAGCDLLAPGTKSELEQSAGKPCRDALPGESLPAAGAVRDVATFGTMAQVRFAEDTLFLAEFRDGWKVVAAGCSPVRGHPYDCVLQGA